MKTILVPATGRDGDNAVFATALAVARLTQGQLDFLHVRADPADIATAIASTDPGGGIVSGGLIEALEAEAAQRETHARETVERFCAGAGLSLGSSAAWHREVGREGEWLADYGRTADLVVAGRTPSGTAADLLEGALLDSGRPVLVPSDGRPLDLATIAIAWKSTREAARAVAASMPLLAKAGRIVILHAEEKDEPAASAPRLQQTLQRHGLKVEIRIVQATPAGAAAALLAAAADAGLLVMGGYGHNRLREWVFGGVTAEVLRAAPLPVLMSH